MGKEKNLEKIASQNEFKRGVIRGIIDPNLIPYNIGNITEDKITKSSSYSFGNLFGSLFGSAGLVTQAGIYFAATYYGYPEILTIPVGISAWNYFRKK